MSALLLPLVAIALDGLDQGKPTYEALGLLADECWTAGKMDLSYELAALATGEKTRTGLARLYLGRAS
jgi:hypothetical protein